MMGLVIFLGIVLAIFIVSAIVLVCLITSLSRKIAQTQQNVQSTRRSVGDLTDAISVASSAAAIFGTTVGVLHNFKQSISNKKAKYGKKTNKK